jgi:cobalt-zinc-cadmium efflux system membrane fusion protein
MNKMKNIVMFLVLLALMACTNQDLKESNVIQMDEPQSGEGIFLSSDQLKYADVQYGSISEQVISSHVQSRGKLVLPVNAKADMVALYPGIIQTVYVNNGDPVIKGQLLTVINSPGFINAQKEYIIAKHRLMMLELEYERQKELNKDKVSSDKYFQRARADYQTALAELNSLKLELKMAGAGSSLFENENIIPELRIFSPMLGYVENIMINPGKHVGPEEDLLQVINRDELLLELSVFEKDILKIKPGQRITFTLSNMNSVVHEASILSIGNTVEEATSTVKVLGTFSNESKRMLPGMFVAAEIHIGETRVHALPEEAVLRTGNDEFIIFYTLPELQSDTGTTFMYAAVETGNVENGYIETTLLKSIPEDAMIVIGGGYYLKTEKAKLEE